MDFRLDPSDRWSTQLPSAYDERAADFGLRWVEGFAAVLQGERQGSIGGPWWSSTRLADRLVNDYWPSELGSAEVLL